MAITRVTRSLLRPLEGRRLHHLVAAEVDVEGLVEGPRDVAADVLGPHEGDEGHRAGLGELHLGIGHVVCGGAVQSRNPLLTVMKARICILFQRFSFAKPFFSSICATRWLQLRRDVALAVGV